MNHLKRLRMPLAWVAIVLGFLVAAGPLSATDSTEEPGRLRELYIPFDEFRKIAGDSPDGLVIDLEEYRSLVRAALRAPKEVEPVLPPIAASVIGSRYVGSAIGERVQIEGTLTVLVTTDGWVLCPLGSEVPHLASVTVDGAPGWVIRDGQSATLLLRGKGRHTVEVSWTATIGEDDAGSLLSSRVIPATAGSFTMTVPGLSEGRVEGGVLSIETTEGTAPTTTFEVSLGSSDAFRLGWQRERTLEENPLLLAAEHRLSILARSEDSRFSLISEIEISRRPTSTIRMSIPPELIVVGVTGDLLHAWAPVEGGIELTLREPTRGGVRFLTDGSVAKENDRVTWSPPRVEGASSDRGLVSVFSAGSEKVEIVESTGFETLDPSVGSPLRAFPRRAGSTETIATTPISRSVFTRAPARATAVITEEPTRLTVRQNYLAHEDLERRRLHGVIEWRVESGRVSELSLDLPSDWRLLDLRTLDDRIPFRIEQEVTGGIRTVRIIPSRSLDRTRPFTAHVVLDPVEAPTAITTEVRSVSFPLPIPRGAILERSDLGLILSDVLVLTESAFEGWRTIPGEDLATLLDSNAGLAIPNLDARLVVAVTTDQASPRVTFAARRLPPRGEVRSVTHLLAAERVIGQENGAHAVRVRTDLQVVVLSHAIDTVTIEHPPLPADHAVHVLGDAIREVESDPARGRQIVRFVRPWTGARQLRIEYEVAATPGTPVPFPEIGLGDQFSGPRFLAIESQGSVEVEIAPGAGLARIDIDDLPDFAEPWQGGRLLEAFRHRSRGSAGTFTTTVHARAPVITQLARTLELLTVLGSDRSSRTFASILLSSAREQTLRVDLPSASTLESVTIDGAPIRHVRTDQAGVPAGFRRIAIPLPPRSHARLTILTEQVREGGFGSLGARSRWQESGLRLVDVPVAETTWVVYHPPEWTSKVGAGGNLVPTQDGDAVGGREYFARTFFGSIFRGEWPHFTVLAEPPRPGQTAENLALTPEEAAGAQLDRDGAGAALLPKKSDDPFAAGEVAVRPQLHPSGTWIILSKFGGDPVIDLDLREFHGTQGRSRFVFAAVLLLCIFLDRFGRRRELLALVGGGLFLGTFLPPAIGWSSPLIAIPFAEALVVALAYFALRRIGGSLLGRFRLRRDDRRTLLDGSLASTLLAAATIGLGAMLVLTPVSLEAQATGNADLAIPPPFDTVLIPYDPANPPWGPGSFSPKVYLSPERFRALWKLAHPEETPIPTVETAPVLRAIGAGEYRLSLTEDRFRLIGSVPVRTFSPKEWTTIALPTGGARLERVLVDGVPVGTTLVDGAHRLPLRGDRVHHLELEWVGALTIDRGVVRLKTPLVPAAAARVTGVLPAGAEIDASRSSPGLVVESSRPEGSPFAVAVGTEGEVALTWSFPSLEGDLAAQTSSTSYTELTAGDDQLAIVRIESVRATGRPLERARYTVAGDFEITEITGPDVAEWSVRPTADRVTLEVTFRTAIPSTRFRVLGFANARTRTLPTLTLEGAVRQESYIGLRHAARWRFGPEALAGLARASVTDAGRALSIEGITADRVHHAHGDADGAVIALVPTPRRTRLETSAVARITGTRLQLFFRTRFVEAKRAPLRIEIPLEPTWDVSHVESPLVRRSETIETPGGRVLRLDFVRRPAAGDEILWSTEIAYDAPPSTLTLPFISVGEGADDESLTWTIVGEDGIGVTTARSPVWEAVPVSRAPVWVAVPGGESARLALRSTRGRGESPLTVEISPRTSLLRATIASFAHLGEGVLTVHSKIAPEVRFQGRDTFSFLLPPGAELVDLVVRDERTRVVEPAATADSGARVTVRLLSPVTGRIEIDTVYRIPRSPSEVGGGASRLTPLVLLDDRGAPLAEVESFVGVVQPETSIRLELTPEGLTPIERERTPFLPAGVRPESIRATWTTNRTGWSLTLTEEEIVVAEGLAALVPLLDLTTRIGTDGTMRTEATITLVNERLQFLTVDLPPGSRLWGVTVDGNPVAVASEGGTPLAEGRAQSANTRIRVPVDPAVGAQLAREIVLTYEEPDADLPAWNTEADLRGPQIAHADVRVVETIWTVRFPRGYSVEEVAGRMRQTPPSARHAERLRQLMEQQETVLEASKSLQSRRGRARAAQQLARIEQQLGDSLAGLNQLNRSGGELSQSVILGEEILQAQWRANDVMAERTRDARRAIRTALEAESGREAGESPDTLAFADRARFLQGKEWRDGARAASRDPSNSRPSEGIDPARLATPHPYASWQGLFPLASTQGVEVATPNSIVPDSGLAPLPEAARLRAAAGFPPSTSESGQFTYTFRSESEARLTLALRRDGAGLKWWSWGVMLLGAGALWLWRGSQTR